MTGTLLQQARSGSLDATKSTAGLGWLRERIEAHPTTTFALLTVFYVLVCACMSHLKLLWLDELITLHIAKLATVRDIWIALRDGADPNPPLVYLLVHATRLLFGEHEFALRLPAVCGYWLAMLALFCFLRRRLPAVWALAGTALSMTMAAFEYSFESRSYALFYGLAMAAFCCWTVAADPAEKAGRRRAGIVGMGLALAAGISTNYFAVLAFLPIAAGEVVRLSTRLRQRGISSQNNHWLRSLGSVVDLPLWLSMAAALTPLLVFRPWIAHSIAQFAPHAWNKVSPGRAIDSYTEMVEVMLYPLLALFLLYGVLRLLPMVCAQCHRSLRPQWLRSMVRRAESGGVSLPPHETTCILLVMLYPWLGFVVASIRGGMMSPRFVMPVCLGFAIAGVVTAHRLFAHLPRAGVGLLCFCMAWFVAREGYVGYTYADQRESFHNVVAAIPLADSFLRDQPAIVVPDPLMVLTLQHYAPPAVSSRVVFPVDFPAIRKFRGEDSPEQNLWAGRDRIYPVRILPLATFQQGSGKYLILASATNWLLHDLDAHHYEQHLLPIHIQADGIGGFTPLMHGQPALYSGTGVLTSTGSLAPRAAPIPFEVRRNLPDGPDIQ